MKNEEIINGLCWIQGRLQCVVNENKSMRPELQDAIDLIINMKKNIDLAKNQSHDDVIDALKYTVEILCMAPDKKKPNETPSKSKALVEIKDIVIPDGMGYATGYFVSDEIDILANGVGPVRILIIKQKETKNG